MMRIKNWWNRQTETNKEVVVLLAGVLPWLASPFLGLASLFHDAWWERLTGVFRKGLEAKFPYIWLAVLSPIAVFAYAHPAPPDDLLRDLVSGFYHFDYHRAYWGSPRMMRGGDLDIGFDRIASWVYGWLPPRFAFLPFQITALLGFAVALPFAIRRQMPRLDPLLRAQVAVVLSVLVWTLPGFSERITSARPENFMALWVLALFLIPAGKRVWIWIWMGVALIPTYWLSCAYFPAALFIPAQRRFRVAAFVALGLGFLGFWLGYSDGQWVTWLLSLHADVGHRVAHVEEDMSAGMLLLSFSGMVLLGLALAFVWRDRGVRKGRWWETILPSIGSLESSPWIVAALFAWFMIPDMIRYVDVLGPLAAIFIARMINRRPEARAWLARVAPMPTLTAILVPAWIFAYTFHPAPMNDLHLPGYHQGQKALAYFSDADYDLLYENPGIRLAPAMELGMTSRAIQKASFELKEGKVNCPLLERDRVRWVATPKIRWDAAKAPACLKLVRIDKSGMTLWRVVG
ncbi:hypothetical protein JKG47_01780 [Acidithiobacillus sp. MC6.1]|nr:hypothetical protein [Acidithiobacillus sp. MC6.1]